jgi:Uncharacterized protein conserved in archaea
MSVFKDSPMPSVKVIITAPVYATEDEEKVRQAVSNIVNHGRPKNEEILIEIIEINTIGKNINCNIEKEENNPPTSNANHNRHIKKMIRTESDLTALTGFHYLIRKEEIIDTAKSALSDGVSDDGCETSVLLNKQAAFMKKLSFPADIEPLGSIEIEIQTETADALSRIIDWLTPPTKDGIPVFELKINEL